MGQKVHPIGFRTGIYIKPDSEWFARRGDYARLLVEDVKIREFIENRMPGAEISSIKIFKAGDNIRIEIYSARPGVVIGKQGKEIDALRQALIKLLGRPSIEVSVKEVENAALDATIVAKGIADQLERRVSYKRAMKKAAAATMKAGARGIKIRCAGRLGGAEIARAEWIREGSTPLHTLRADIDYALVEALTTYGIIGIKVWICRGEYKLSKKG